MASRKTMVRTITSTTINSISVKLEKGEIVKTENAPLVVSGTVTEEKALKEVIKKYGQNTLVTGTTEENAVYEMAVEDFIKNAKKVEQPTPEQVAEGQTGAEE